MPNKTLLDCFYRGLKTKNRRIVGHLCQGRMLNHPYNVVATLLGKMVETNKEDQKKYEWDKLVAQVDALSKRVMVLEEQAGEKEINFSIRGCKWRKKHEIVKNDNAPSHIQQKLDDL